jgi:hypothetical protein
LLGIIFLHGGFLLVMFFNCLCVKHKEMAIISFMQCKMLIIDVLFHVKIDGNHDLCGGVTELHGFCGR